MAGAHRPFPREIEADRGTAESLRARLGAAAEPLWSGASLSAPHLPFTPALAECLAHAARAGALVLGLEAAADRLGREARGLDAADARRGEARRARVSRLLLVADDGAERFYRAVEGVLRQHGERLLACRLATDAARLGQVVTGTASRVKAVLVEDKRVVAEVLAAIGHGAPSHGRPGA